MKTMCGRERRALSTASRTIQVRMWAATLQVTIIRLKASTMTQTDAIPKRVGTSVRSVIRSSCG